MAKTIKKPTKKTPKTKKFLVDLHWDVAKQYTIEAENEEEAFKKMDALLNSGEVCVWTDGFETTDDTHIEVVGEELKNGKLKFFC